MYRFSARIDDIAEVKAWHCTVDRLFGAATVVAFAIVAAVVLLPPLPPLQDYSEWVYQGIIAQELIKAGGSSGDFALRSYPVPNALSQLLIAGLTTVMPDMWAAKVVVLLYLGLVAYLLIAVHRMQAPPERHTIVFILFGILLGSQFLNGYLNSVFGMALLALYALRLMQRTPPVLETLIFSVLIFLAHAVAFAVFGLIVTVHVLMRQLDWRHGAALVPGGLCFLWYMAVKDSYVERGLELRGMIDWFAYKAYAIAKFGPYHNFFFGEAGDLSRLPAWFWFGVGTNVAFGAAVLVLLGQVFAHHIRRDTWRAPVLVVLAILTVAYPFMPLTVSGVVNIGERFFGIILLLLILTGCQIGMRRTFLALAAISLMVVPSYMMLMGALIARSGQALPPPIPSGVLASQRIERLFWHRPFQDASRAQDILRIRSEGLGKAAPLGFHTSVVATKKQALPTK